jgi:hypothetical protein
MSSRAIFAHSEGELPPTIDPPDSTPPHPSAFSSFPDGSYTDQFWVQWETDEANNVDWNELEEFDDDDDDDEMGTGHATAEGSVSGSNVEMED